MYWSMRRLKVGDVVRKRMHNGSLIGPYLRIEAIRNEYAYVSVIEEDTPNEISLLENLGKVCNTSLLISEPILERIKSGNQTKIRHALTLKWQKLLHEDVEIIRFYCTPKGYHIYIKVENVELSKQWYNYPDEIVVTVEYVL